VALLRPHRLHIKLQGNLLDLLDILSVLLHPLSLGLKSCRPPPADARRRRLSGDPPVPASPPSGSLRRGASNAPTPALFLFYDCSLVFLYNLGPEFLLSIPRLSALTTCGYAYRVSPRRLPESTALSNGHN
jgi:hypothetical protein